MPRFSLPIAVAAVPLLGACDLVKDTKLVTAEAQQSAVVASQNYEPVMNGDMTLEEAAVAGMTGYVGNHDGSVSEVLFRVSEDGSTLYVSRDGGEEVAYDTKQWGGSTYGRWSNGSESVYVSMNEDYPSYISPDDGSGYGGLETDPSMLPAGQVIYVGNFYANGDDAGASGTLGLNVDFASSGISGITTGSYWSYDAEEDHTSGGFMGTVAGTVTGSRVGGTIFAEGTDMSGEFDFMGGIYGEEGEYIAGGVGGTMTTGESTSTIGGQFHTSSDDGHFN